MERVTSSAQRTHGKATSYGGRSAGRVNHTGGFGGQPYVSSFQVDEDEWNRIFGKKEVSGEETKVH